MIKLSHCTFCGKHPPDDLIDTLYPSGTYWHEEDGYRFYSHISDSDAATSGNLCWTMNCTENLGGCGANINGDSKKEVIDKWNRRNSVL